MSDALPTPFDELVLDLVAQIPPGQAVSYGDVARILGSGGPRQVGRTMSRFGEGVPWWRVVRADGSAADEIAVQAHRRWAAELMPRTPDRRRIDLSKGRWQPAASPGSAGVSPR